MSDNAQPEVDVQVHLQPGDRRAALERDVRLGLSAPAKSLPPIWFYDEHGSELFEEITQLEEYYPTRTERAILDERAHEIIGLAKADTLVELGSGSSEKTRLLLDAMSDAGRLEHFVPFDVSETMLRSAAEKIRRDYRVSVTAVVGDFQRHLGELPRVGRRLVVFLGGTIGNLNPEQRRRFLRDLESTMDSDDWLLLGTDLIKDTRRLVAAYDDAQGITAAFNVNVLSVINNELDADFDLHGFEHLACWNDEHHWIEMRLRSTHDQLVTVRGIDAEFHFAAGEQMRTEISTKFTTTGIAEELAEANFVVGDSWTDDNDDFLVSLSHPYC